MKGILAIDHYRPDTPGGAADEDEVTMGAEACSRLFYRDTFKRTSIDKLVFTSFTYRSFAVASTRIKEHLSLPDTVLCRDVFLGTRSTLATLSGILLSPSKSTTLIVSADMNCSSGAAGTCAIVIGETDSPLFTAIGHTSITSQTVPLYKYGSDGRWMAQRRAVRHDMPRIFSEALKTLPTDQFKALLVPGSASRISKSFLQPNSSTTIIADPTAPPNSDILLSLAEHHHSFSTGDQIALASYGDGCEVLVLERGAS